MVISRNNLQIHMRLNLLTCIHLERLKRSWRTQLDFLFFVDSLGLSNYRKDSPRRQRGYRAWKHNQGLSSVLTGHVQDDVHVGEYDTELVGVLAVVDSFPEGGRVVAGEGDRAPSPAPDDRLPRLLDRVVRQVDDLPLLQLLEEATAGHGEVAAYGSDARIGARVEFVVDDGQSQARGILADRQAKQDYLHHRQSDYEEHYPAG
jgi:hypothetical protein